MSQKQCGTCHYWRDEESDGYRMCHWPRPPLPFWATISEGDDHNDWTKATDGRRCPVWTEIEL